MLICGYFVFVPFQVCDGSPEHHQEAKTELFVVGCKNASVYVALKPLCFWQRTRTQTH